MLAAASGLEEVGEVGEGAVDGALEIDIQGCEGERVVAVIKQKWTQHGVLAVIGHGSMAGIMLACCEVFF